MSCFSITTTTLSYTIIITKRPTIVHTSTSTYHIRIDIQDVQDDDELERELEALLAPQRGRAPCTTKILI